jgi:predicted AAA+ superfamily ATPase
MDMMGSQTLLRFLSEITHHIEQNEGMEQPRFKRPVFETALSRIREPRRFKPALLRQLFRLGCDYSAPFPSYQKMVGQLQDVGNTTTLAHYLELLAGAGMLAGLQKFSGARVRQRGSSPKLLVMNMALMTASSGRSLRDAQEDRDFWGRLVESAVGAHLLNTAEGARIEVFYWREGGREVDYVLRAGRRVIAVEVTSGRKKEALPGMDAFDKAFRPSRRLLVGGQGCPSRRLCP